MIGDGRRTKAIFSFIIEFMERECYPPSRREIARGTDISSIGVVTYHINWLVENGFLKQIPGKSRSVIPDGGEFQYYGDRP